ncbi:uncharacterized protein LOC116472292 [Hylobates moloch]|uniref:uncharacterized protein LOC116472292 n=1 Tax=Hylobates moloch TaxID=81572 RepID=UPI00136396C1|nr:uncharacterized protein LOC116472292 [Hylobates moloch]
MKKSPGCSCPDNFTFLDIWELPLQCLEKNDFTRMQQRQTMVWPKMEQNLQEKREVPGVIWSDEDGTGVNEQKRRLEECSGDDSPPLLLPQRKELQVYSPLFYHEAEGKQ